MTDYKLRDLREAASHLVPLDLSDRSSDLFAYAGNALAAPTAAFGVGSDLIVFDGGRWRGFCDEGEVRPNYHLVPPSFITPETLADWYRSAADLYSSGYERGREAGKDAVERKVKEVGKLIFGDVIEDAIRSGVRDLIPTE